MELTCGKRGKPTSVTCLCLIGVEFCIDLLQQSVLIEGVLFRARYLGSTQLVCEGQPTKTTRMMQAEEAVSRIKVTHDTTRFTSHILRSYAQSYFHMHIGWFNANFFNYMDKNFNIVLKLKCSAWYFTSILKKVYI